MNKRVRVPVAALTITAALIGGWKASEGFSDTAIIPTRGDVPTIGHGSTRYEDGSRVKLGDTITRQRAGELALNLMTQDAKRFAATLPPGTRLHPEEFAEYLDFTGQFGIGNWSGSSMRRNIIKGDYVAACDALLLYRKSADYDCSQLVNGKPNKVCYGVWKRQLERHAKCKAAQ